MIDIVSPVDWKKITWRLSRTLKRPSLMSLRSIQSASFLLNQTILRIRLSM